MLWFITLFQKFQNFSHFFETTKYKRYYKREISKKKDWKHTLNQESKIQENNSNQEIEKREWKM